MDINNYQDISKLVLVYRDVEGELHRQPAWEVVVAGPVIDAETEEAFELVGFILTD